MVRRPGNASPNGAAAEPMWILRSLDRLVGRLEAMVERLELVQNATTANVEHVEALDDRLHEQIDAVARLGRQVGRLVTEGVAVQVRR
jgi:hypothetical protein